MGFSQARNFPALNHGEKSWGALHHHICVLRQKARSSAFWVRRLAWRSRGRNTLTGLNPCTWFLHEFIVLDFWETSHINMRHSQKDWNDTLLEGCLTLAPPGASKAYPPLQGEPFLPQKSQINGFSEIIDRNALGIAPHCYGGIGHWGGPNFERMDWSREWCQNSWPLANSLVWLSC